VTVYPLVGLGLVALLFVVGHLVAGRRVPEPEHSISEHEFTALARALGDPAVRKSIARHHRKERARAISADRRRRRPATTDARAVRR
jgi:hypothetical protein